MLRRLSRARIPFRRCLQTQPPPRPASTSTKYAIVVGTFATVAFLGSRLAEKPPIALDSSPSREFAPPPLPTFQHPASAASTSTIPDKRVVPKSKEVLSKQNGLSEEALSAPIPSTAPSESAAVQDVVQTEEDANTSNDGDSGGGAFNPETGEINWDCPCLGGMADGPCGPEFREAFSCFVYSEDEPKGINCVEKFQGMQTCFREHPEVYASEIADDEAAEEEAAAQEENAKHTSVPQSAYNPSPPAGTPPTPAAEPTEEHHSSPQ